MQELASEKLKPFDPSSRPQQVRKSMRNAPLGQHQAQMAHGPSLPRMDAFDLPSLLEKPTSLLAHNSSV